MAESRTQITMITDPLPDADSQRLMRSVAGCRRVEGSPSRDGAPTGSRSVFEFDHADLVSGRLEACIELLGAYGINVHRIIGDHPAVTRANRRLGYV
jgi:hypothetical protein